MPARSLPCILLIALWFAACGDPVGPGSAAGTTDASVSSDAAAGDGLADSEPGQDATADTLPAVCQADADCQAPTPRCHVPSGTCVPCLQATDCGVGQACLDLACISKPTACKDTAACTPFGQICDVAAGQCVDCLAAKDCGSDQVCAGGQCLPASCTAGGSQCQGNGTVLVCAAGGWQVVACGAGTVCLDGVCATQTCQPGVPQCSGGQIVTCNALGTGTTPTLDCGAKGEVCDPATVQCVPKVCNPGQVQCDGDKVMGCDKLGTAWAEWDDCFYYDEVCIAGQCVDFPCKAGGLGCDGSKLVQCDATGKAFSTVEDCSAKGQACDGQQCVAKACNANDLQCDGDKIMACNAKGTGWSIYDDCGWYGEVCVGGKCVSQPCKPGDLGCLGDQVVQCDATGPGYSTVEDCAAKGEGCDQGQCKPQVCQPGQTECDGTLVYACNDNGTDYVLAYDCAIKAQGCSLGKCVSQICAAGATTCQGAKFAVCAADGLSWQTAACPAGAYCVGSGCVTPACALPSSWNPNVQKVAKLALGASGDGCDLNGDGAPDNALAQLGAFMSPKDLQGAIDAGELVLLLEPSAWATDGTAFDLRLFDGALDPADALCNPTSTAKACAYTVHATGYDLAAKSAQCPAASVLSPAEVQAGQLLATSSTGKVVLPIGTAFAKLAVALSKPQLQGTATGTTTWQATQGKLCGAVTQADLEAAIDALPPEALDAIGIDKATLKGLLAGIVAPDLDLDGDGKKEGISAAFLVETVPGVITGITK